MVTLVSRGLIRLMQLGFINKVKCCMNSNSKYSEVLDGTDSMEIGSLKPMSIFRHGDLIVIEDLSHDLL